MVPLIRSRGMVERGFSVYSIIFWLLVLSLGTFLGIRITPAIKEYVAVHKVLAEVLKGADDHTSMAQIRKAFDAELASKSITSLSGEDLEVWKDGGRPYAAAKWRAKVKLVANVFLIFDWETFSTDDEPPGRPGADATPSGK